MKKTLSILLSAIMLFSFMLTGCAEEKNETAATETAVGTTIMLKIGSPAMTVNGESMPIDEQDTAPVIVNDRTLLPVRAVVEQMGGTVGWNDDTEEVTLKYGNDEIKLTIGSQTASLNGDMQTLDVAPAVMNDRTMLPIRFIAESFKFSVDWNEKDEIVTIANTEKVPAKQPDEDKSTSSKSLTVYFSATGNTKALAEKIAAASGSDIAEIIPKTPYTSDDLDYSKDDCRANKEQNDSNARPEISNKIENIEDYDVIFIGYPIWWGTNPKIIDTFLESYDLSGKTIMPFCTSGGSGISSSVSTIKSACPNSDVKDGFRGSSSTTDEQLEKWFSENGFEKPTE